MMCALQCGNENSQILLCSAGTEKQYYRASSVAMATRTKQAAQGKKGFHSPHKQNNFDTLKRQVMYHSKCKMCIPIKYEALTANRLHCTNFNIRCGGGVCALSFAWSFFRAPKQTSTEVETKIDRNTANIQTAIILIIKLFRKCAFRFNNLTTFKPNSFLCLLLLCRMT